MATVTSLYRFAIGFVVWDSGAWDLAHGPFVFSTESEVYNSGNTAPNGAGWEWWLERGMYPVAVEREG